MAKTKVTFENRILRGHIIESCGSIGEFAKRFGITETAMGLKLHNKSSWKREEIIRACTILGLNNNPTEAWRTFFSLESWENPNGNDIER